jgi:hypothetical protein
MGRTPMSPPTIAPTLTLWRIESEAIGLSEEEIERTIALAQQQLGHMQRRVETSFSGRTSAIRKLWTRPKSIG